MTRRRRTTLWGSALLAALAVGLLAAGCGGDEESASDEATVEATTEEATATETATEDDSMEDDATGDTTSLGAFADEDCLALASIGAKFAEAMGAAGAGGDVDLDETSKLLESLVSEAPDEIKDDLATLAGAWKEIAAGLEGVDLSSGTSASPEDAAKLAALGEKLSTPELQQASDNLSAWADENCGTGG